MSINFEADETSGAEASNEQIQSISLMIKRLQGLKEEIESLNKRSAELSKSYEILAKRDLPEAMRVAGMSQFTTDNGFKVSIKEDIFASIAEKNKQAAFAWLAEHGFGDLIKTSVDVSFGRGEHERVAELLNNLNEHGYQNYGLKEGVHPGTLKAFLREQIAQGKEVPLELFGAFQYKEVVFK